MSKDYYPPKFKALEFHCPYCGVYSSQHWLYAYSATQNSAPWLLDSTFFCLCEHCKKNSIWYLEKMIEPNIGGVPIPNQDLPDEIIFDYNEARDILNKSPRGASAILRLAIQKLCVYLGEKGKNINDDISSLVKKGLPVKIQQSLDYVRVIGNNAVHPGQLDLKDNPEIASNLFKLINVIADVMITQPKEISDLYENLPEAQLKSIEKRDNKTGT
jgi:hypothetical protein